MRCMPGSAGISVDADLGPGDPLYRRAVEQFVGQKQLDLVVFGPVSPGAGGISVEVQVRGGKVFGAW